MGFKESLLQRYPKDFFVKGNQRKPVYSYNPNGTFELEQLLKNNPPWKTYQIIEESKIIVVADWTLAYQSSLYIEQFSQIVKELLDDQFIVHILQNKRFIALNLQNLHLLHNIRVQKKMDRHFMDEIKQDAAMHFNIPINNILILDNYWKEYLQNYRNLEFDNFARVLPVSILEKIKNSKDLITYQIQLTPPLTEIVLDKYSSQTIFLFKKLRLLFPQLTFKTHITEIEFAVGQLLPLMHNNFSMLSSVPFDANTWNNLEKITIDNPLQVDSTLEVKFKFNTRSLKELTLKDISCSDTLIQSMHIQNLSKLNLYYVQSSPEQINCILARTKYLKELQLIRSFSSPIKQNLVFNWQQLEVLQLDTQYIANETLDIIFQTINPIKKFYLKGDSTHFSVNAPSHDLLNLEELHLNFYTVDWSVVVSILDRAPNLKIIILNNCHITNFENNVLQLKSSLVHIQVTHSNLPAQVISLFLSQSPQVTYLDLSSCIIDGNEYEHVPLTPFILNNLQHLNLSEVRSSFDFLSYLFTASKNLKKLECINIQLAEYQFGLLPFNFIYLKKLNLSQTLITRDLLKNILLSLPILEHLILKKCKLLDSTQSNMEFPKSLVILNLDNNNLSNKVLQDMLSTTNNLQILTLNQCIFSNGNDSVFKPELASLKKLYINDCDIHSSLLCELLNAVPQLQVFELTNTFDPYYQEEVPKPLIFLAHLTSIQLGNHPVANALITSCITAWKLENKKFFVENLRVYDSYINTADLETIFNYNPIKKLTLQNCNNIQSPFTVTPNIEISELNISGSNINPMILSHLIQNNSLEKLILHHCESLSSLLGESLALANLVQLDLKDKKFVDSSALMNLCQNSPQLESLNITHCPLVSLEMITFSVWPLLKELHFNGKTENNNILFELLKALPFLHRLTIVSSSKNPFIIDSKIKNSCLAQGLILHILITESKSSNKKAASFKSEPISAYSNINNNFFHLPEIFSYLGEACKKKPISSYRMQVFDILKININNCRPQEAFFLENSAKKNFKPIEGVFLAHPIEHHNPQYQNKNFYLGNQTLKIGPKPKSLASLSTNEHIHQIFVFKSANNLKLTFCVEDNLYYISASEKVLSEIQFLLEIKETSPVKLPQDVIKTIEYLSSFEEDNFISDSNIANGEEYLKKIFIQKRGSCTQRTVGFIASLENCYSVRAIANPVHMFAEIKIDTIWVRCDLGGAPVIVANQQPPKKIIINKINSSPYFGALQTWGIAKPNISSVPQYFNYLLQSQHKNHLIYLDSLDVIDAMQISFEYFCTLEKIPILYSENPSDFSMQTQLIRDKNKGRLISIHPVLQFAQNHQQGLIVISANNFNYQTSRFNSLLDTPRSIDGIVFSSKIKVICLISKGRFSKNNDFYSKFDAIEQLPFDTSHLLNMLELIAPLQNTVSASLNNGTHLNISLFNSHNWKNILVGAPQIQNQEITFETGLLSNDNHTLILHNAPWSDRLFQIFWRKKALENYLLGKAALLLILCKGYNWEDLFRHVSIHYTLCDEKTALVLNLQTYNSFFKTHTIAHHAMFTQPGYIEQHTHKILNINLTSFIDLDDWAMFLTACQEHKVKLNIFCAPNISLNKHGAIYFKKIEFENKWSVSNIYTTQIIFSTDVDITTLQFNKKNQEDWFTIDCTTDLEPDNLLLHTKCHYDSVNKNFKFDQSQQIVLSLLNQSKNLILKGSFNTRVIDALAPYIIPRKNNKYLTNQLIIISDQANFNYWPMHFHQVSRSEKVEALSAIFSKEEIDRLDMQHLQESYCKLRARLIYFRSNPSATDSNQAWQGLVKIESSKYNANSFIDKPISTTLEEQRIQSILNTLKYIFFVVLTGETAVGKTSLVLKLFPNLFQGEDQIELWALSKQAKPTLFLDEANCVFRNWLEFETLFNTPPYIYINGLRYDLHDHQIVFACNPCEYGGDRQLPEFFMRHGNCFEFKKPTKDWILEYVVKPLFKTVSLDSQALQLSSYFFEVYDFIDKIKSNWPLISCRELETMSMLLISYKGHLTLEQAAHYFAYKIGKVLIPAKHLNDFILQFKPQWYYSNSSFSLKNLKILSQSQKILCEYLSELLQLRRYKMNLKDTSLFFKGMNGLVIQGEPGTGKTTVLMNLLLECGYCKINSNQLLDEHTVAPYSFFVLSMNMEQHEKLELISNAFKKGVILIILGINTCNLMERQLNHFLMGTDQHGNAPKYPGFFLIATQHPISKEGRYVLSPALSRRLLMIDLEEYNSDEMKSILALKGLLPEQTNELLNAYNNNKEIAKKEYRKPEPCFTHLMRLAEKILDSSFPINHGTQQSPADTSRLGFFACNDTSYSAQNHIPHVTIKRP